MSLWWFIRPLWPVSAVLPPPLKKSIFSGSAVTQPHSKLKVRMVLSSAFISDDFLGGLVIIERAS